MKEYVRISLETHVFFARIMKEHAFFLQAAFVQKDIEWIRRADYFRREFEALLRHCVRMGNRRVSGYALDSGEFVTDYTMDAERKTTELTGISIDRRITAAQKKMECAKAFQVNREDVQMVQRINERAVELLNGLIDFQERLLKHVEEGHMYTANYPLLIEHITREARLYREIIEGLVRNKKGCYQNQEEFWNCIMMEHALFVRGLLDPCEGEMIKKADHFAGDFSELLEMSCEQTHCDNSTYKTDMISENALEKTYQIRDFKAAGAEGLINSQIKSIILPLLADHVLREANYYIRIMKHGYQWKEE